MPNHPDRKPAPRKTIHVTQEQIDNAVRCNARTCAIAVALAAMGALRPFIHRGKVAFTLNGERFSYNVPPEMSAFIHDYDRHGRAGVTPRTFELREGLKWQAVRTGGDDRTQRARHAPGGRASRAGYRGPRQCVVTNQRLDGFAVVRA